MPISTKKAMTLSLWSRMLHSHIIQIGHEASSQMNNSDTNQFYQGQTFSVLDLSDVFIQILYTACSWL